MMMNDFEQESMRQQMTILKNKLERQEILNDRILRQSMKKNVNDINRRYYVISILCLLVLPYGYWAFVHLNGMSLGFWAATSVFMLIVFVYTYFNGKQLRDKNLFSEDLLQVRKKVAHAKKLDHDWLKIGIPMLVLWFCYFGYEVWRLHNGAESQAFLWGGIVGGLIGGAAGWKMHLKTQRNYQEVIDQIAELAET